MKTLIQPLLRNLLLMITICGAGAMINACDDDDNSNPKLQNGGYKLTLNGEEENEIKSQSGASFRFMVPSDTSQFPR
jgi:major membrane immunogen (membrane-anchored lipoprotein)